MTGLQRGTVKLMEHQSVWKIEAEQTIAELKNFWTTWPSIFEHIGSTAIPLIHAKPIIDIAVGVHDLSDIKPYAEALRNSRYVFRGEDVPGQTLFVKGDFGRDIRTHHIHVVEWNGIAWNNYIDFRDYLNAFPEKAKAYDTRKLDLAERFPRDRGSYTQGKQRLVSQLIEEARKWKSRK